MTHFLLCLPRDVEFKEVVKALGKFQKKHHPKDNWRLPDEYRQPVVVINAPDLEEEELEEISYEMRQKPHRPEKVK